MRTTQQYTEIFHLLLLRHLESKIPKNLYVLKGGCNLRFFFRSIRYSEDIDFDIKTVAKDTLRSKITKLLQIPIFEQTLFTHGIEIFHLSETKQTDTTQRWKLSLRTSSSQTPIPTKIEFSRRGMAGDVIFEPVTPELIHTYQLYPVLANHYALSAAFSQKIDAISHRSETQTRDIFDLKLLLDQGANLQLLPKKFRVTIDQAIKNIKAVGFSEFKSQVVAYLIPEYQAYYDSQKIWEEIKSHVTQKLENSQR